MYELALFAGAGGGILGGHLLGWRTICAVERDLYAASVLAQRQNDGHLAPFPIWSDVCSFDGRPWRRRVDVVSGGFPCQDISAAGRGAGIAGSRSGLWGEMVRIVREVEPRFVFVENSPMLTSRGLGVVLGDLAAMGFDAEWCVLGAHDIGAPHRRDRIWILAHTNQRRHRHKKGQIRTRRNTVESSGSNLAHTDKAQCKGVCIPKRIQKEHSNTCRSSWWSPEPNLDRVAYGVAHGVDRLRALGNGQVPGVAALAFNTLYHRLINE